MGVATGTSQVLDNEHAPRQVPCTKEANDSLVVRDSAQSGDYHSYLARATNDAVRDWNVTTGTLCWPQGLQILFGYSKPEQHTIEFWDQRLHPADRATITGSIRQALASETEH